MSNVWKRVREQNRATLYADDEPYVEYMKRMLEESVQYKPKEEENTIEKYMDYEVEEQEEEPKKIEVSTGSLVLIIFAYVMFFGGIVFVLYELFK